MGAKVYIEGQLQTLRWGQDGKGRSATKAAFRGFNSVPTTRRSERRRRPSRMTMRTMA
jgi:single-stranded DNA-binding protein